MYGYFDRSVLIAMYIVRLISKHGKGKVRQIYSQGLAYMVWICNDAGVLS